MFACLGVALALHGRHAIRARVLNVASAGASVFMNVIAAAPGWRDLAVWTMPPAAYALASDTLIGVVRAWVIARHSEPAAGLAAEEATLLAMAGGLLLWLLRLSMAPASTLAGFRAWVLEECPVAPGRRAARAGPGRPSSPSPHPRRLLAAPRGSGPRGGTKTARFLALVTERHGPLAAIPLEAVAKISAALAPQVDLNAGAARAALRRAVLAAQERRPAMIIKYAIALAVLLAVRRRVLRLGVPARPVPARQPGPAPAARLHLRLHPGKGFATVVGLWLRWGRLAALRRSGRIRRSLPLWQRMLAPGEHSVFVGRAHWRHGLRVPLEEHVLVMAPPRTFKTAFLADVILRYPGPVIATTTKADVYALTGRGARRGAARCTCSTRSTSAGCRPRSAGPRSTAARTRPPRSAARTRSRSRSRRQGVEDGTFWSAKASDYLRGYFHAAALAGYRHAGGRRLGIGRRPARPGADPARRRGPAVGADAGRAALRGAEDHRHRPHGDVPRAGVHGRPGAGRQRAARPRRRVRHPAFLRDGRARCT